MKPKTTEKTLRRVESIVREMLDERYGEEEDMTFDPIVAIPRVAYDGLEYVKVYIGFEGDETRLDASWYGRMSLNITRQFTEEEISSYAAPSLVPKSEWDADWDEYILSRWME